MVFPPQIPQATQEREEHSLAEEQGEPQLRPAHWGFVRRKVDDDQMCGTQGGIGDQRNTTRLPRLSRFPHSLIVVEHGREQDRVWKEVGNGKKKRKKNSFISQEGDGQQYKFSYPAKILGKLGGNHTDIMLQPRLVLWQKSFLLGQVDAGNVEANHPFCV
jgi:hypothetical protein